MTPFLLACWDILVESSIWMLFGFFMAGLLRAFVPSDLVARHLGRDRRGGIVKAALFGIPLPLCSCGVIPAAAGLRRQGASKGATASFLIATPETGVDSMAASWALLDPLMTVLRPFSALVTAVSTGLVINLADARETASRPPASPAGQFMGGMQPLCSSPACSCHEQPAPDSVCKRFLAGQRFAFGDLMADMAVWFGLGVMLAATITLFLPEDLATMLPGGTFSSMLVLLAISLPMYVCATASTPIAAALALKGFSPGALLVFLLAGPATNAATMTMVGRLLGKKAASIYIASIVVMTMTCGLLADALYVWLGFGVQGWLSGTEDRPEHWLAVLAAVVMSGLLAREAGRVVSRRLQLRTV